MKKETSHPERSETKSRDPGEVTLKLSRRDPSASLGMTVFLFLALTALARADDVVPKRPEFALYQGMLNRSPFAVATAVAAPVAEPDFARDLYVANAGKTDDGVLVTIASTTDRNLKEYLDTKGPNEHGFAITDIKWADRPGETKVTISKDGKYATLSFNQALMSQQTQNPAQQLMNLPVPQPQPFVPTQQPYAKAPVPMVPQPVQPPSQNPALNRIRSRGLIQRNPAPVAAPTPNVPATADDQD
jgi:hypothetical protein